MTHWSIMVTSNVCTHTLFPYIQPVSPSLEPLHKSLLSASSNPKLGCLSDLIGYALFVVLTEECVRVCVKEREEERCWLSDGHWSSHLTYRGCLSGLQRWYMSTSWPRTHTNKHTDGDIRIFNSHFGLYLSDFNLPLRGGTFVSY